jgi:CBS domain-containing protein
VNIPSILSTGSLAEAIDIIKVDIDRGVIVLDENGHVLGILTEGDIIRAMRRGILKETLVGQIMTGHVQVTTSFLSSRELAREFAESGTLLIPVVDSERRLVDVQRAREAVSILLDSGPSS